MDDKTLEALKASIAKWERNARVRSFNKFLTGIEDCPLCDLFFDGGCVGCPVMEKTGKSACRETPYETASAKQSLWWFTGVGQKEAHAAASTEVAFLKSLLPKEA